MQIHVSPVYIFIQLMHSVNLVMHAVTVVMHTVTVVTHAVNVVMQTVTVVMHTVNVNGLPPCKYLATHCKIFV